MHPPGPGRRLGHPRLVGEPVEIQTPAYAHYRQAWNADGNLVRAVRYTTGGWSNPVEDSAVTTYAYHPTWKAVTQITPPLGGALRFDYDGYGRQAWAKDGLDHLTAFGYNSRGQLVSITQPGEAVPTRYTYDTTGTGTWNLLTSGDSAGTTRYGYAANGSDIVGLSDLLGNETQYTYDGIKRPCPASRGKVDRVILSVRFPPC